MPPISDATAAAMLPFILGGAFAALAMLWAQILDNGTKVQRRRFAEAALAELAVRPALFRVGRSSAPRSATPTVFLPKFLPEPLEPAPDSPIGGEVEGADDDTVPLPSKPAPAPAGAHRWPTPVLLPQPRPTAEAVLFQETGAYPVLNEDSVRSDITVGFRRLTDAYLAELEAAGIGAR